MEVNEWEKSPLFAEMVLKVTIKAIIVILNQ